MIVVPLIIVSIISIFYAYRVRLENKKILYTIDNMIDMAIEGNLLETSIDESMLSKIEMKFKDFLYGAQVNKLQMEIERASVDSLISDISHQVKTPLSNIILYSQLLIEDEKLEVKERERAEIILSQGDKLKFLIENLVKLSRLEAGVLTIVPKKEKIIDVIDRTVSQLKLRSDEKNIIIDYEFTEAGAIFDKKWTEEAFYNIVDNAIKYSPENSKITISTLDYEMFLRIDVKDQGVGISEQELPKIFKRFYRTSKAISEDGVGIGLHLAQKIIVDQGGYIKVVSSEKGSKFSVFLPKN